MSRVVGNLIELCVFKKEKGIPFFLLLHRTKDEKLYPNIWQFITGSIEDNENAVDASLRELAEETGLKAKSLWVVPYVISFYDAGWDSINLCPFFAAEVQADDSVRISDEHDDFGWYTYEEAIEKLPWPDWKEGLRIVHQYILADGETAGTHKLF